MKMVNYLTSWFVWFILTLNTHSAEAQPQSVSTQELALLISKTTQLIEQYYITEKDVQAINQLIETNHNNGAYESLIHPSQLASKLTADLRQVNGDLHLTVKHSPKTKEQPESAQPQTKTVNKYGLWSNYGIQELKVMPGNIGYIKLNHFSEWQFRHAHRQAITRAIEYLQHIDFLIIDVSDNTGGYEDIVAYLVSYFFTGQAVHLSDYYVRYNDETKSLWTQTDVPGPRLAEVPIYVLVNGNTASAGESLAYMLKHLNRATVIGQKTAGAGHGAMSHQLNERFSINISSSKTINAVTKSSFESIGVIPDIESDAKDLLNKAYQMAVTYLSNNPSKKFSAESYDQLQLAFPLGEISGHLEMQEYNGVFSKDGLEIVIEAGQDFLNAQIKGKGTVKLIPAGDHIFIVQSAGERIEFKLDQEGKVIKLVGLDSPLDLPKQQ